MCNGAAHLHIIRLNCFCRAILISLMTKLVAMTSDVMREVCADVLCTVVPCNADQSYCM